jgi:starvation-inducible DNA-binding protein
MAKSATIEQARMFPTEIDLPLEARREVVGLLNQQLADTLDLYSQAKHAHWNVKGMHFFQLHKLFDELAEMLEELGDVLAERATALGGTAMGSLRMAAATTALPEFPMETVEGMQVVEALVERVAAYSASAREAVERTEKLEDMATNDLFIDVARGADKFLYFLESHLQA